MTTYENVLSRLGEMRLQMDQFETHVKNMWDSIIYNAVYDATILGKLDNEDGYNKFYGFMIDSSPGYNELAYAIEQAEELLDYLDQQE